MNEAGYIAEISSPDYPNQRLFACYNSLLADKRSRVRDELIKATEKDLGKIVEATKRVKRKLHGKDKIGIKVGRVINRHNMAKHFKVEITEDSFSYCLDKDSIDNESKTDGIYIVRTNVTSDIISATQAVAAYKSLSQVEKAFRCSKTIDLQLRPVFHYLTKRVKAHVFLCMLAYYVEWHMRSRLAPLLFEDHDKELASSQRTSPVTQAKVSLSASRKALCKKTDSGYTVHSFQGILVYLKTITKNYIQPALEDCPEFSKLSELTPLHYNIFSLLKVTPEM